MRQARIIQSCPETHGRTLHDLVGPGFRAHSADANPSNNFQVNFTIFLLVLTAVVSLGEHLPVKTYTTRDGLPANSVTLVKQDSRGFIWMAASDGISRFDGYKLTTYTTDDGLADRRVNDLLETTDGVFWMATGAGLCRFNPVGQSARQLDRTNGRRSDATDSVLEPMFVVYNPDGKRLEFNALVEGDGGTIWCATNEGLYRLERLLTGEMRFSSIEFGRPSENHAIRRMAALIKDRNGSLWGARGEVLDRVLPGGAIESYTRRNGLPPGEIISLLEDRDGNIWAGTQYGLKGELIQLVNAPDPSRPIVARIYGDTSGLPAGWINSLWQTRDGTLWAATPTGLFSISLSRDSTQPGVKLFNAENGLCNAVSDLTEDTDGNLWVASGCGLQMVQRNGFTGFGPDDGLGQTRINSIFENPDGKLYVISTPDGVGETDRILNEFDGTRFRSVDPNGSGNHSYKGWGWGQTAFQDRLGDWWISGPDLKRFPKVDRIEQLSRTRPQLMRMFGDDVAPTEIFRIFEDSRGDIWAAATGLRYSLLRWERATKTVHDHTSEIEAPPKTDFTFFREDLSGNLWIGTSDGLVRYRDGAFKRFTTADGSPPGWIIWLYLDHAGRLWIASQLGGLICIENPAADSLTFKAYTTIDGLSSNNIRSITEDNWGRIYACTGHGVDRLDVETGAVKHFTEGDGLPKGIIETAFHDRSGALWFGSLHGLSRFIPEKREERGLPSVYLTGLRVEGISRRVSELGATTLPTLDLNSYQRQISVDFVGLGTTLGEELTYQYRLEGANDDWSPPAVERTINFASLAPGVYHLRIRAIDADGRASLTPAAFTFSIATPIWQRSWFLALITLTCGLVTYALYRYRLERLLELERIRTRIATDLHDDIGSSLSQVSVLSEVVRRKVSQRDDVAEPLSTIATLSRDLIDSMSDIVWAINPNRDRLVDLTQRMRRFANDILNAHGIECSFNFTGPHRDIKLGPDMRRELFLIFKESINNIVRHSGCAAVEINLVIGDGAIDLKIIDTGHGFAVDDAVEGNGLESMRRRAQKLGGELRIESAVDSGTVVELTVPLGSDRWERIRSLLIRR